MLFKQQYIWAVLLVAVLGSAMICRAQSDYDDDGYGNQAGNGGGNQGDNDGYQNNYDDGYSGNMPNFFNDTATTESSNNNPSSYSPQGGSDAEGDYEGDDGSAAAAASSVNPTVMRVRRSVDPEEPEAEASMGKLRVKRHGKYYIGPVYTYVKTDKHANFKWGVKHKVGKKHYG